MFQSKKPYKNLSFNLQFSDLKVPEPVDTQTAKIDAQEKEAVSEPFPAAGVVLAFCGDGKGCAPAGAGQPEPGHSPALHTRPWLS